ncbi:MAG: UDP-N-acetylglucosamine 1-carboxyvinyltransferase [Bergeyella sp.]|nr:UDP-N-acetylglucosamine 1-carboxyvinyltransferase [Bergeyella sp.]
MGGSFLIRGGKKLQGEITPQGAKNEALQILCAVLLTEEEVRVKNIPDIHDVNRLIEILGDFGVSITKNGTGDYTFKADQVNFDYLKSKEFKKDGARLRGSVMLLGPMLSRFGEAYMPTPGGDKIGRRRLDTHFHGFVELGAEFKYLKEEGLYSLKAKELRGKFVLLEEASVTGTANIVMSACLAKGKTRIYNAACEPYIQQLCKLLNRMGANISGLGSNLLTIEGVDRLGGAEHTLLPDMVEIGSWIGLAAMTRSHITIKNVHWNQLGIIPGVFRKLGIAIERRKDDMIILAQEHYEIQKSVDGSILTISDAPWPGFTPDLLSIILVVASQASGTVLIHQKMFESRLFFVDRLIDMGAQIILCDPHRATIVGLNHEIPLRGATLTSPDIRAGNALLIAALSAEGKSIIHNIEQIDRGYENIDKRLRSLGAEIERV